MNPGTTALVRGLEALVALSRPDAARDGLGVTALATELGADKSQVSRTLQTLEEHGFAERDPVTLAYRLGPRVFALAARAGERRLLRAAPPVMRALVRRFGESVHLSVRQGAHVLTLLTEAPETAIHAPGRVGGLTPLATTSAGRALALDLDAAERSALGLEGVAAALAEARRLGHAIVREEFEPGLVAAAAPIRDGSGRVIAALNISAPTFRFDTRLEEAAVAVSAAAARLSATMTGEESA